MKPRIKEAVVVEGRDDIAAVKRAVDCEVIATHGFGYGKRLKEELKSIQKRKGIIILTDADYIGKMIRKDLSESIPKAKHAFLSRSQSLKDGDIGVENASPMAILEALKKARATCEEKSTLFTMEDLLKNGLVNVENSSFKRDKVCDILKIGHGNAKQTLNRLNSFGITKSEFEMALKKVNNG